MGTCRALHRHVRRSPGKGIFNLKTAAGKFEVIAARIHFDVSSGCPWQIQSTLQSVRVIRV